MMLGDTGPVADTLSEEKPPAPEVPLHALRRRWEAYIRIPQEERETKLSYLDRFLPVLLVALSSMEEDSSGQLPYFSDLQSVSSILASEFLVDIHHICSQSDDDDISQLEQYLRYGRGAILLRVLNTTGVQGLSCGRELGDLLVSLLQLSCKFPERGEHRIPGVFLEDMSSCFSHLIPRNNARHNLFPTLSEVTKQQRDGTLPGSDRWQSLPREPLASQSESGSSDSDADIEATPKRYKKPHVGSSNPQGLFQLGVFPGLLSHLHEEEDEEEQGFPELDVDNVTLEPLSPLELCVLLLSLICSLCRGRWKHMSQHKALAPALLPNLLQFMHNTVLDWAPGSTADKPEGWTLQHAFFLKRYLARVLVTLASYVSLLGNGLFVLNASGVIGGLLEISQMYLSQTHSTDSTGVASRLILAHDILTGVWLIIHSIFQGIPLNPSYLSHAVRLFSELHQRDGLTQAQDLLLQLEASATSPDSPCAAHTKELSFSLVAAIGSVLGSLKKAKVDYIHSTKCVRRRHRTCDYSSYVHHHHNILGTSSTAVSMEQLTTSSSYGSSEVLPAVDPTAECKAAIVGEFLLELYTVGETRMLKMRALSAVDQYGLCCCMHPQQILSALLPGLEGHPPGIRNYVLCVLTKALMEHCGGAKAVQQSTICKLCKDHRRSSLVTHGRQWSGLHMKEIPPLKDEADSCDNDSALSSDASTQDDVLGPTPRWQCLQHIVPLIVASPDAISIQVTQHLLRLISQAGPVVRHEIFMLVFLPLLQAIQNTYPPKQPRSASNTSSDTLLEHSISAPPTQTPGSPVLCETVVHYILAALPLLLETHESQELFLDRSGLNQLLALFHVPAFRRCVLSVFQVLIVLEDQRSHDSTKEARTPTEEQHLSDSGSEEDNHSYWFNVIDTFMSIVEEEGLHRTSNGAVDTPYKAQPNPSEDERTTDTTLSHCSSHSDKTQTETSPDEPEIYLASEANEEQTSQGTIPANDSNSNLNQIPDDIRTKDPGDDPGASKPSLSHPGPPVCDSTRTPSVVIPGDLSDLSVVCDVWVTCSRLYPCSKLFQGQLALQSGLDHAAALLRLVLDRICAADDRQAAECMSGHQPHNELMCCLSLAESCLLLCLASFNTDSKRHKQESLTMKLMSEIHSQLSLHSPLPSGVQRLLCDMLLHCAMQHRSMQDIVQNHTFAVMHLHIDDSDDVELQELSDYCSTTKESETCFTELGYEADDSDFSSDQPAKIGSMERLWHSTQGAPSHVLRHPHLCRLVLDVLLHQPGPLHNSNVLAHVLLKLISLSKHSAVTAATLYKQGLIPLLLEALLKIIENPLPDNWEPSEPGELANGVQIRLLLDLFLIVSQHALDAQELKQFLRLFMLKHVPLESVLPAALNLAQRCESQPSHYLTFPVLTPSSSQLEAQVLQSRRAPSTDQLAESLEGSEYHQLLHSNNVQEALELESMNSGDIGDRSSLSFGPMQLQLPAGTMWPQAGKGFSIALWLRLSAAASEVVRPGRKRRKHNGERDGFTTDFSDTEHRLPPRLKAAIRTNAMRRQWNEACLHVATLGGTQRQVEVWIDPETAGLICRLVQDPADTGEVMCEASLPHLFSDRWQHLAMTFIESAHGKRHAMTIQCFVDGCYNKEVCLEYRRPEMRSASKESSMYLALGHVLDNPTAYTDNSYQLGAIMLFRDTVLTKTTCFYLSCLGPDCVSISECDASHLLPDYTRHISQRAVCYGGLGSVLSGQHSIHLSHLKENLILAYSPQHPEKFNLYVGKAGHPLLKRASPSSRGSTEKYLLLQSPSSLPVTMMSRMNHMAHHGLHDSIHQVGGVSVFFFLFAKVIELSTQEKQQAQALELLFTVIGQNSVLWQQFSDMSGYNMLAKVLATPRCMLGYEMLQVLLDAMLTAPIMVYDSPTKSYRLDLNTKALIQNRSIITHLLLCVAWHKADVNVWKMVFDSLALLVRPEHPHREFNIQQLHTVHIVDRFMHLCQERYQKDLCTLPVDVVDSVLSVLRCMLETPPDMAGMRTLCSFLFWMHPAESHFVHSQVDQFYFIHKWAKKMAFSPDGSVPDLPTMDSLPYMNSFNIAHMQHRPHRRSLQEDHILNMTQLKRSQSMPTPQRSQHPPGMHLRGHSSSRSELPRLSHHTDSSRDSSPLAEHRLSPADNTGSTIMTLEPKGSASEYDILTNGSSRESGTWPVMDTKRPHSQPTLTRPHNHRLSSSPDSSPPERGHDAKSASFIFGSESSSVSERSQFSPPRSLSVPPLTSRMENIAEVVIEGQQPNNAVTLDSVDNQGPVSNLYLDYGGNMSGPKAASDTEVTRNMDLNPKLYGDKAASDTDNLSPLSTRPRRLADLASTGVTSPATSEEWQFYPTVDATTPILVHLRDSQQQREDQIGTGEMGHVKLYAGLLNLVTSILPMLNQDLCGTVLVEILRPELLLAMAHHNAAPVRTAVLKLLHMYLRLSTSIPEPRLRGYFQQREEWHLLATQLHQHRTTRQLLDAAMRLMAGTDLKVDQGCAVDASSLVPRRLAVIPVLALLEGSVVDTALCHNTLLTLKQVFETVPELSDSMLENALLETLCNIILVIHQEQPRPTELGGDERTQLITDVQYFFLAIVEKVFNTSGLNLYHHLDNTLVLLHSLEAYLAETYGLDSEPVGALRNIQCHILRSLLETAASKEEMPAGRFFTSRLGFSQKGGSSGKRGEPTQGELVDRFKRVVTAAVELAVYIAPHYSLGTKWETSERFQTCEESLRCFLLQYLRKALLTSMERSFFQRKSLSAVIMSQARDVLRTQFSYLLCYMLAPSSTISQQMFAVDVLLEEPRCDDLIKHLAPPEGCGQKLMYFLFNLTMTSAMSMTVEQRGSVERVMRLLHDLGVPMLPFGVMYAQQLHAEVDEVLKTWEMQFARDRIQWLKRMDTARDRLWRVMEQDTSQLCKRATDMTKLIVDNHRPHEDFKGHIKKVLARGLETNQSWQRLIHHLTHPRAVWHCPESAPCSWQLDPTEGPCRVRRRLMRCHLGIPKRFISKEYQHHADAEQIEAPLSYLFAEDPHRAEIRSTIFMSHKDLVIIATFNCTSVTPSSETPGNLLIDKKNVFFIGDDASNEAHYTEVLLGQRDELLLTFPTDEVKELQKRWWQLRDNALEIFLMTGRTCLLAFRNTQDRDHAFKVMDGLELPNRIPSENVVAIQQLWLDGRLTNFEYLTHLNKLSGRSFNDLMQYPVFPFILASYDEETLDLEDPELYRNLAKPISVQQKSREEKYMENYRWLEQEQAKFLAFPEPGMYAPEPYHYGSHYSNSGTVLHFLVRLPPFTQMFLTYQDKNFDIPDRTFHCLKTSWHLASFQSTTDVKELIPEFFFFPEFLVNGEGFNFGTRQTGEIVWDVKLPPWAHDDPRLFTLIHRQALESDYVTAHLASWIDLVFGFKQSGKAAIENINVFHPATYFGVEVDTISDPLRRRALKTMIKTYGQTPKQLFRAAHPVPPAKAPRMVNKTPTRAKFSALSSVSGMKWGNYVGSPDQPDPRLAWSQSHHATVSSLVALPTGQVFGLGPNSHLLVMYSKERGVTAVDNADVHWAAILSWGHPDSILRITNRKGQPPVNFMHWSSNDEVTCCASVPDVRLLFLGTMSGIISVIKTCFNRSKACDVEVLGPPQHLCGHWDAITMLCVCKAFSIVVSASRDTSCIVWDLNRLSYVFSIDDHTSAVQVVCVSDTSGDVASVSHKDSGSQLMLHTVTGQLVGSVDNVEFIHSLVFSTCHEGRSINVIAGGLSDGSIRMWSSWDLSAIRDITVDLLTKPVVSLCFTCDCQQLYASCQNGTVALWEKPNNRRKTVVSFIPFL